MLETVARAGSLAGTYAWSVWLLSPAGHLWAGCSAQLAGWLIAAAFRRKVVRSKTISPAKRFRPSCSGRMAHSCPAYDTDRTPILEIWQIFRSSIMEAVSFCAGVWHPHGPRHRFPTGTGPGDSSRQESRTSAHFFVKKDLHPRKKHRRQRETPPTPVCCCK